MVEELRRELPKLENFVTLSPVPGFVAWLKQADDVPVSDEDRALLENLEKPGWFEDAELAAQLRAVLEPLAAYYFLKARTPKGRLIDSVARFHLGNGARLERIDWFGDLSPKGQRESAGIMVNYLYRLEDIEKNHEAYANQGEVAASSAVKRLLKNEGRRLLEERSRIEAATRRLYRTWSTHQDSPADCDALSRMVLRPIQNAIGRKRLVVVVPDGALANLSQSRPSFSYCAGLDTRNHSI